MEHGSTFLCFLPFFAPLQHFVQQHLGLSLSGQPIAIEPVLASGLVAMLLLLWGWRMRRRLYHKPLQEQLVPGSECTLGNVSEMLAETLHTTMTEMFHHQTSRYFGFMATISLFILISNLWGLLPGLAAPTASFNTTFACGLLSFLYYHGQGLRCCGWAHLRHIANPTGDWIGWCLSPLFFPIEIFSHFSRPFTLGIRLFVNMSSDHTVLASFFGILPILLPLPFFALGLLVAVVQTMVFLLLSLFYLQLSVIPEDH